ncbi:MAG: S-methyl-5-thioribose-1-phosphate isomerase [Candidatus Omnitrophica bacterium]|nr:S-methyl-5-thioribose-1-phosphate isomerase [Candidatus Omnitrophota bacterium]
MIETLRWRNGALERIDQRLLPGKFKYIKCKTARDVWDAIKKLKVRGAPAIGVAGAYGLYLGIAKSKAVTYKGFYDEVKKCEKYLAASRPTAINLCWGLSKIVSLVEKNKKRSVDALKKIILGEAQTILEEDKKICRDMGKNGAGLIPKNAVLLTHCNAGALATADFGTALGVIYSAKKKVKKVFADETRPVLQGARLTVWELQKNGINTVLICDNMAASVMRSEKVDAVIVGADRIAANGDTANKIGTYGVAILAAYHKIPFYVAAPVSTFDLSLKTGKSIPIEERDGDEVRKIGGKCITVKNMKVKNPAFDVTPARLITAIVTEKGIIYKPNSERVKQIIEINQ